jgi:hypothetical protein
MDEVMLALQMLRSSRARTLSIVGPLTQSQMDYSPGAGKWSICEVLDHLVLAEAQNRKDIAQLIELSKAGKIPVVRRSLGEFNISPAFLPKCFLPYVELPFSVISAIIPASFREAVIRYRVFQAVAADTLTPRKLRQADALRTDLKASLTETERLLETHRNFDYQELLYQHPILGTNNVPQLIRLLALHEQRHQEQINDILTDREFPTYS